MVQVTLDSSRKSGHLKKLQRLWKHFFFIHTGCLCKNSLSPNALWKKQLFKFFTCCWSWQDYISPPFSMAFCCVPFSVSGVHCIFLCWGCRHWPCHLFWPMGCITKLSGGILIVLLSFPVNLLVLCLGHWKSAQPSATTSTCWEAMQVYLHVGANECLNVGQFATQHFSNMKEIYLLF